MTSGADPAFEARLADYAAANGLRHWAGVVTGVAAGNRPRAIAARIGLPTARIDPFRAGTLVTVDRDAAARVLAVSATVSLSCERPDPPAGAVDDARRLLAAMGCGATFLANGFWRAGEDAQWAPMTAATYDCGVIGDDGVRAFIAWHAEG